MFVVDRVIVAAVATAAVRTSAMMAENALANELLQGTCCVFVVVLYVCVHVHFHITRHPYSFCQQTFMTAARTFRLLHRSISAKMTESRDRYQGAAATLADALREFVRQGGQVAHQVRRGGGGQ